MNDGVNDIQERARDKIKSMDWRVAELELKTHESDDIDFGQAKPFPRQIPSTGKVDVPISFEVRASVEEYFGADTCYPVVDSGTCYYWVHNTTSGTGGYLPKAYYTKGDVTISSFSLASGYVVVFLRFEREIDGSDVETFFVTPSRTDVESSVSGALDAACAGCGWSTSAGGGWGDGTSGDRVCVWKIPLALIDASTGRITKYYHTGDLYARDDPHPGAVGFHYGTTTTVQPGWKLKTTIGGESVASRYLRLTAGAAGGIGGNTTHTHTDEHNHSASVPAHNHSITTNNVEVESGIGTTIKESPAATDNADLTITVENATGFLGTADNDPIFMDFSLIEKL